MATSASTLIQRTRRFVRDWPAEDLPSQVLLVVDGAGKGSGNYDATKWYEVTSVWPITGTPVRGDTSVTFAVAAEAGNLAAGDIVYLRTGQTVSFASTTEPDAEILEVLSADSGTGVVRFRWPILKDYAQEYFITGTTTTTTAQLAPGTSVVPVVDASFISAGNYITIIDAQGHGHSGTVLSKSGNDVTLKQSITTGVTIASSATVHTGTATTSTTPTSRLAVFGIAKVTANTIQNVTICDLALEHADASESVVAGGHMVNYRTRNLHIKASGAHFSHGALAWAQFDQNRHYSPGGGNASFAYAFGKGCSRIQISDPLISGEKVVGTVFSEGTTDVIYARAQHHSTPSSVAGGTPASDAPIIVQSRSGNIQILDPLIVNSGNYGIIVAASAGSRGGFIRHPRISGSIATAPLQIGSANWRIDAEGSGSPESAIGGSVGSIWRRTDGGASTTLYVKESGTGSTGWVGK